MYPPASDCSKLTHDHRAACRKQQARTLQHQWLITLTWGSELISAAVAEQLQIWLGIFPVNWRQLPDPALLNQQVHTLCEANTGGFGQLLEAMVIDPALQISLNGPANQSRNPNENLARELLELFSLGEGHYGEADVMDAARALTGYRLNADKQIVLEPRRHDSGPKTILGRRAAFEASSLTSWLAEQPATARHIIQRLWRSRIGTSPPAQRLQLLAEDWRQQQLSVPWLFSTLEQLPETRASRRQGLRLADPLEMMARSLRLLGSRHPEAIAISLRGLKNMGQAPFEPPSVKGWPVNEQWIKLRWLHARRRTLQQLLVNEEVWASRQIAKDLAATLTAVPPLTLSLPAPASRDNLATLFADPVWQLG